MRIIFGRVHAVGLKFDAVPKCSFGLKKIPYLVCVITREGMTPDQNKVQVIMDIRRLATNTEARALIGIVQ